MVNLQDFGLSVPDVGLGGAALSVPVTGAVPVVVVIEAQDLDVPIDVVDNGVALVPIVKGQDLNVPPVPTTPPLQ